MALFEHHFLQLSARSYYFELETFCITSGLAFLTGLLFVFYYFVPTKIRFLIRKMKEMNNNYFYLVIF